MVVRIADVQARVISNAVFEPTNRCVDLGGHASLALSSEQITSVKIVPLVVREHLVGSVCGSVCAIGWDVNGLNLVRGGCAGGSDSGSGSDLGSSGNGLLDGRSRRGSGSGGKVDSKARAGLVDLLILLFIPSGDRVWVVEPALCGRVGSRRVLETSLR